jgi:hypothetical protein
LGTDIDDILLVSHQGIKPPPFPSSLLIPSEIGLHVTLLQVSHAVHHEFLPQPPWVAAAGHYQPELAAAGRREPKRTTAALCLQG